MPPTSTCWKGEEDMLAEVDGKVDAVVVDPPRAGLGPEVIDALAEQKLQRIVGVPCDPATLPAIARGWRARAGTLEWVQPVDLFPQTYHIENVALLSST